MASQLRMAYPLQFRPEPMNGFTAKKTRKGGTASSPDLNPLDFAVLGCLEPSTNKISHSNLDSLKVLIHKE